jgi:hypothetical protein
MKMIKIVAILISVLGSLEGAASEPLISTVKFERVDMISIKELSSLAKPEVIFSNHNPVIVYWPFGRDEIIQDGEWLLLGITIAGFGDVGETPIGAKVWAKSDVKILYSLSRTASESGREAIAVFATSEEACAQKAPLECAKALPNFSVDASGRVTAGGVVIGTIR